MHDVSHATSEAGATLDMNDFHRGAGGHASTRAQHVKHAEKIGIKLTGKLRMCEACHMGLLIKNPIPKETTKVVERPGQELTFLDLTGPFPVPEPETSFVYFALFVDALSTRPTPIFLTRKQDVPLAIESYYNMLRGANIVMKVIRMDGDGTNVTASVAKVLERLNIQLEMRGRICKKNL